MSYTLIALSNFWGSLYAAGQKMVSAAGNRLLVGLIWGSECLAAARRCVGRNQRHEDWKPVTRRDDMPDQMKATVLLLCVLGVLGALASPSINGFLGLAVLFFMLKGLNQIVR